MSILKYPDLAFETPEVISKTQEDLLRKHLRHTRANSPYYQEMLKDIDIENVTLDSLSQLPLTDKSEISQNNSQFQAVSNKSIVDVAFSSGTTGEPTKIV